MKKSKKTLTIGVLTGCIVLLWTAIMLLAPPMLAPGFDRNETSQEETVAIDNTGSVFSTNSFDPELLIETSADSYLVYNEITGETIAAKNAETPVAIASLTKLMTAYLAQKYGDLEDVWAIDDDSAVLIRPLIGFEVGDRMKVKHLVNAMLIGSANDAAQAIGNYITTKTNTDVVTLMNTEAQALGMHSTRYENPIGFDSEQNYSTAADLRLLLATIRKIPLFTEIDRAQSYSFVSEAGHMHQIKATNQLISLDSEIHAIKTGFTEEAGGAMITSVQHESLRFVIIVLGSQDREKDTLKIKEEVLRKMNQ